MSEPKTADRLGLLKVGRSDVVGVRWAAADVTGPMRTACERLDLSPVAAGALGRCLAGAALLQRRAPEGSRLLALGVVGDGPLERVVGEADAFGSLRGMVSAPHVELPVAAPGELGVGRAIGDGVLRVWNERSTFSEQSHVEVSAGRIGDALARFLLQSHGTHSAVLLGVLADADGIAAAGGLIVEPLPGANVAGMTALESRIEELESVSRILAAGGLDGLVEAVLVSVDAEATDSRQLRYRCRCSRGSIGRYLAAAGEDELEELRRHDGSIEAECVFCGQRYLFDDRELGA